MKLLFMAVVAVFFVQCKSGANSEVSGFQKPLQDEFGAIGFYIGRVSESPDAAECAVTLFEKGTGEQKFVPAGYALFRSGLVVEKSDLDLMRSVSSKRFTYSNKDENGGYLFQFHADNTVDFGWWFTPKGAGVDETFMCVGMVYHENKHN